MAICINLKRNGYCCCLIILIGAKIEKFKTHLARTQDYQISFGIVRFSIVALRQPSPLPWRLSILNFEQWL